MTYSDPDYYDPADAFYSHAERRAAANDREFFNEHFAEFWTADEQTLDQISDIGFLMFRSATEQRTATITVTACELLAIAQLRVMKQQIDEQAFDAITDQLENHYE